MCCEDVKVILKLSLKTLLVVLSLASVLFVRQIVILLLNDSLVIFFIWRKIINHVCNIKNNKKRYLLECLIIVRINSKTNKEFNSGQDMIIVKTLIIKTGY